MELDFKVTTIRIKRMERVNFTGLMVTLTLANSDTIEDKVKES